MHEFSLIADLLKKIRQIAEDHRVERVVGVKVRLGALAHISAEHFREHFVEWTRGTPADGARLEIEVGTDEADPFAQDILLLSVDVPE